MPTSLIAPLSIHWSEQRRDIKRPFSSSKKEFGSSDTLIHFHVRGSIGWVRLGGFDWVGSIGWRLNFHQFGTHSKILQNVHNIVRLFSFVEQLKGTFRNVVVKLCHLSLYKNLRERTKSLLVENFTAFLA